MAQFIPVPAFDLVIVGATGDLARRKLLPALFHRFLDGQIEAGARIIGAARSEMSRDAFRAFAQDACRAGAREAFDEATFARFAALLDYVQIDAAGGGEGFARLAEVLGAATGVRIFYLATSPSLYVRICEGLGAAGLAADARVVLEKPIGTDLASAQAINAGVGRIFPEPAIFRIDHYLGKETVQNLLVLRFANTLFEPLWSRTMIDHVQITVAETLGVEGRASYYDQAGALRDMVQNHLLQLLCLTAMEPPNSLSADHVRTEKIKVLEALRPFDAKSARADTVRAQYRAGVVGGAPVPGYVEEVGQPTRTETYVAIRAEIDNWRWAGVPFYLRTGKRLGARRSHIVVTFKPVPHALFGPVTQTPNRLVMRLQPDEGVQLSMQFKEPGPGGLRIKSAPLNLSYADTFTLRYPDAYERLLMDVVRGNLSLFMRRDEVETAWAWVDGLIDAWAQGDAPVESYAAGSEGPLAAALLLARHDRGWLEDLE
ncbi:MAG: glucose-6-phosphate dehydrogenase [Alphaproteobacteria bacterium]|nr:glucose-6-phosphate dehydrogenase [Alphaproteobacteria bacterium]